MKKHIYIRLAVLLTFCLAGCASHTDKKAKDEAKAEATKTPETDKNTNTEKQVEETPVPSETPTVENEVMAQVSVLEHLQSEDYMDVTEIVVSGVYIDEKIPYIITDHMLHSAESHKIHRYRVLTGTETEDLTLKATKKETKQMHPAAGQYAYTYSNRIGMDDKGHWYEFSQKNYAEVTEDLPALWLFDEKKKLKKRISWIPYLKNTNSVCYWKLQKVHTGTNST